MHVCNSFRVNQCGNEQFNKTQIKLVEKKSVQNQLLRN